MIRNRGRYAACALALAAVLLLGSPAAARGAPIPELGPTPRLAWEFAHEVWECVKTIWHVVAQSSGTESGDEPAGVTPEAPAAPQPQGDAGGVVDPNG